jgi:hypothetical protein
MTAFLSDKRIYAYLAGSWVDLTAYVVRDNTNCAWGILGNSQRDRVASAGSMTFTLNNSAGLFSPERATAMTGWKQGVPVKLVLTYDGQDYIRFPGRVGRIGIAAGVLGQRTVSVTVVDWMDHAAKYPLTGLDIAYDQTADQALTAIIAAMPIAPQATQFATGVTVFPAAFDTITTSTRALTEFSKIAASEMGYIYLRHDGEFGETLVFENMYSRRALQDIFSPGLLLAEDGGLLLAEDGSGIELDIPLFYLDNQMSGMSVGYGDIINQVKVTAHPKQIDTTDVVLYKLSSPMLVGSNQTVTFRAAYTDPTGAGRRCNADPATVSTTDFSANSAEAGGGTDLTADFTLTEAFDVAGGSYTVVNGGSVAGWIQTLEVSGRGIYSNNPIDAIAESSVSYNEYGIQSFQIDQVYQRTLDYGQLEAASILDDNKQPHLMLNSVMFYANRSSYLMQAALMLDVGDLVHIKETQSGVDGYFYIQGVRMTVTTEGFVMMTWIVRNALSLIMGLSLIGAEFAASSNDSLAFGYLPQLVLGADKLRSVSAWIYPHTEAADVRIIAGAYSASGGWFLYTDDRYFAWFQETSDPTKPIAWFSSVDVLTLNAWNHVVVTMDASAVTNQPHMYINGVEDAGVSRDVAAAGTLMGEAGAQFAIGNLNTIAHPLTYPFDGVIEDVRVYGRILSADEVAAMAADYGYLAALDGALFQGPVIRTADLAHYTDLTLTDDDKVRDNIFGVVGSKTGGVITRVADNPGLPMPPD